VVGTLVIAAALMAQAPISVVRCTVPGDPGARVYELLRSGEGERARWTLAMRSREAGAAPVLMPLPDAKPAIDADNLTLEYRTLNGGRDVRWKVGPGGSTIQVYANFELEVNVEADLDPRVELMTTEEPITNLSCSLAPSG
jgi:hypothetical protein